MFLKFLGLFWVTNGCDFDLVGREGWGALQPVQVEPVTTPVPFVIIHHTYIPAACADMQACILAMQWMQDFHMNNRTWNDIGYTFAIGGDGRVYEGRGWGTVGAHAPNYNNKSVGITLIGDWTVQLPPEEQLATAHKLIAFGVRQGYIREDYILHGHRQVREGTECPGDRLFKEISAWPHFHSEVEASQKL